MDESRILFYRSACTQHFIQQSSSVDGKETIDDHKHQKEPVYLTSDSETVISQLETVEIHIIGGIVDRNRLKGIWHQKTKEYRVFHGRLPLESCLAKMPSTKVLTCNHVFGILLKYSEHDSDWTKAFQEVLPNLRI
jgi:hypothetical protein